MPSPQKKPQSSNQAQPRYVNTTYVSKIRHGSVAAWRWLTVRRVSVLATVIIALVPSLYYYHQSQEARKNTDKTSTSNLQTTAAVVSRVSRHILLPSGEQPTVATVTDPAKVRTQAFFASAADGDKVLIYAQAKKAYLYRPSVDRLIEVAPLAPSTPAQPTEQEQPAAQ